MTKNESEAAGTGREIAIIGMAGRFPGARNVHEFWNNLKNGVESISWFSDKELEEAGIDPELINHPDYVKAYGILENKEYFDASFFGYTPLEAQIMSPQTRILHECAWEALEDAGYDPELYDDLIGLYAGATSSAYWEALSHFSGKSDEMGGFAATQLNDKDYISTRVSYNLNLKGPSFSLQTACSTSLVAVHLACRGLLMGECKMALAGGVAAIPFSKQGYLYQEGMILSPDGTCRAFDAKAKGAVFGEGVGLVVLKRLKNARVDGDHIYAVIKGTAINNDGKQKVGFTAPSVEGQAEVIQMAQRIARVEPETVSYIETHGTGTTLGDPVEIEALTLAFETDKKGFCAIGSVKSNIGHLDAAAGIAGLIKTVLALKHRQIPPSLHFENPNPGIDFQNTPFYVNTELKEWKNEKYPLRAGLSSFGIGGTNAHAVLEEAPKIPPSSKSREWQMILLSAKTEPALDKMSENLGNYLQKNHSYSGNPINPADPGLNPGLFLADAAYTLQVGRGAFSYRRMAVCSGIDNAITLLSSADSRKVHTFFCRDNFKPVIFMFPGLGGQYVNMGRELYEKEPVFCREMDRCFELLKPLMGYDIKEILYPQHSVSKVSRVSGGEQLGNRLACSESDAPSPRSERSQPTKNPDKMEQLENAQPLLFAVEYALAKLLIHWGINPHAVIGYSFGEYTAACLAGVFSLEDVLMFITARGKLIRELPEGLMVSVPLPRHGLEPFLNDEISLAIDNGPSCIVSGSTGAIEAFEKKMKENRCMCMRVPQTSRAIHSYMMEPVLKKFEKIAGEIPLNMPQITYISNVTGNRAGSEVTKPRYWSTHLRSTVEFAKGIKELVKEQNALFLEVGPGRDLSAMVTRYIQDNPDQQVLNLIRPSQKDTSDVYFLLREIGRLWLFGQKIDWKGFYSDEIRYRVSIPSYPFERERYWIDETSIEMGAGRLKKSAAGKKPDIGKWFYIPLWRPSLLPVVQPGKVAEPCTWLVFMDAWGIGEPMVKRLEQDNQEVIVVRPGTAYGKEYKRRYTVNPGESSDYKALLTELNTRGIHPREIVHLWNVTHHGSDESREEWAQKCQELGYYSLIFLTHAFEDQAFTEEIQITVVTNNMQEVYGDELLYPEKATLLGPVNVIPREYPGIQCRAVDVVLPEPGSLKCEVLVRQLLEEIEAKAPDTNVVYRGNNRLVQAYEPVRLEKPASPVRLRERGVYLVTGGLGDIGLLLAKDMARSVNARLILTGRSEFPAREQWEQWSGKDDAIRSKIEALREIEALGGDVLVCRADVSDPGQMEAVVREGERRFGPINGVIHAALQIDGGVIHAITREKTENVFASKVWGTLVLERIFKDYPLDFMMLFSSLTTVFMEIGHVAYSAGSVFMDAFARHKAAVDGDDRLTISIDWDNWQEVGGALKLAKERAKALGLSDSQAKIENGILSTEGIEVFNRIIGFQLTIPQILISNQDLIERLRIYKETLTQKSYDNMIISKKREQHVKLDSEYVAPRNNVEKILANIWSKFFGFDEVGILDDYFDLGGDSLKAIIIASTIHKELKVKVSIASIFNNSTIESLAKHIKQGKKDNTYTAVIPGEKKEYYPLSSAQKRLYFVQQMNPESTVYNMFFPLSVEVLLNTERLAEIFRQLIKRHESFRTSFRLIDGEPIQKIHEDVEFQIKYYEGKEVEDIIYHFIRPFDLAQAPVLRVGVIKIEKQRCLLLLDMHHIMSDGMSLASLVREFTQLYSGEELLPLTLQYRDFSQWQNMLLQSEEMQKQGEYWLKQFEGQLPVLKLPVDFTREAIQSFEGRWLDFEIGAEETQALKNMARETGTTLYMLLLALFSILLSKICNQDDIVIGTPTAGRRHVDLERVIGMFVNTLPIRTYPEGQKTFKEFLAEVKATTLDAFENQNYPIERLVEVVGGKRDASKNPLFDVMFTMQTQGIPEVELGGVNIKYYEYETKIAKFDMQLICVEGDEGLTCTLEYCTKLFREESVTDFINYFKTIVISVIHEPGKNLSDILVVPEEEMKELEFQLLDDLENK